MPSPKPAALFFFPHQDDEFGIFKKIEEEVKAGSTVCCAYFTDGSFGGTPSERRNQESLAVLASLGVERQNVFFPGCDLSIPDGSFSEYLSVAIAWIEKWISHYPSISALYLPAWEGGHQDHDALHGITVRIAQERNLLSSVLQFSLYNGHRRPGPFFRVFHPLPLNGLVTKTHLSLGNRLRFLRYCLSYPSQAKTWLGLFPFVMAHYFLKGTQQLQPVSLSRLSERPHPGPLLYEKRGFSSWKKIEGALQAALSD